MLGLRWSEVIALRVGDVDVDAGSLSVAQTVEELSGHVRIVPYRKTKGGLRTMAMPDVVAEALRGHIAEYWDNAAGSDALVFVGPRGGILRRTFLKRVLRPAAARAGLPGSLTFHGLRHLAVTSMAEAGVPYNVTQVRAGHSTARMTVEVYSHRSTEADRAAARALDAYFGPALREET